MEGELSGKQTAQVAAKILEKRGYIIPTPRQRQNLLIAFAKTGGVVYGKAFDAVKLARPVNLDFEEDISRKLKAVTLYEIKSTNRKIKKNFEGYFFSLTTAELLVAQSLKKRFRFAFVDTSSRSVKEFTLTQIFAKAKGIYPSWSIRF